MILPIKKLRVMQGVGSLKCIKEASADAAWHKAISMLASHVVGLRKYSEKECSECYHPHPCFLSPFFGQNQSLQKSSHSLYYPSLNDYLGHHKNPLATRNIMEYPINVFLICLYSFLPTLVVHKHWLYLKSPNLGSTNRTLPPFR